MNEEFDTKTMKDALKLFDNLIEGELDYIDRLMAVASKNSISRLTQEEFDQYMRSYDFAKQTVYSYQKFIHEKYVDDITNCK